MPYQPFKPIEPIGHDYINRNFNDRRKGPDTGGTPVARPKPKNPRGPVPAKAVPMKHRTKAAGSY